ncbi:hypothetical protein V1L52_04895 [Treponema sp. HNW]|uniref:hypothetical protein n=1 Tax=Treponema sp. HNW TaxID=3116654 RepID=UPI003D127A34
MHIHTGNGARCARGIIAIGNIAFGLVALGGISLGLFSFGGLSIGLLLALGGVAVGGVSLGGLSIGLAAFGGCALGALPRERCLPQGAPLTVPYLSEKMLKPLSGLPNTHQKKK